MYDHPQALYSHPRFSIGQPIRGASNCWGRAVTICAGLAIATSESEQEPALGPSSGSIGDREIRLEQAPGLQGAKRGPGVRLSPTRRC